MQTPLQSDATTVPFSQDPDTSALTRQWVAVYTVPRHEKQLTQQLQQRSIDCFLPLYESTRRWKTGLMQVALPLFPGYTFVRVDPRQRRIVLDSPSVLRIVGNRLGPTPLPGHEIERLRYAVESGLVGPHPYLTVGRRVRIVQGALAGAEGVLLRRKGRMKVVISVDLIMQSVAVEVNACDLEPCSASQAYAA
jgi:transcription antitermination factor NusG